MQHINLTCSNRYANTIIPVFEDVIIAVEQLIIRSGRDVTIKPNFIAADAVNIVWGVGTQFSHSYEVLNSAFRGAKKIIIFNMEQIESGSKLVTQEYLNFLKMFTVFDYNIHNVTGLSKNGIYEAYEFPIMPTLSLVNSSTSSTNNPKNLCRFAFYGAENDRRNKILKELSNRGLQVTVIRGAYGKELEAQLMGCEIVLNIHAYESAIFESARCIRPVAMGIPILSELSNLPSTVDWRNSGVLFSSYDNLVSTAELMVNDLALRDKSIRSGQSFMRDDSDAVDIITALLN